MQHTGIEKGVKDRVSDVDRDHGDRAGPSLFPFNDFQLSVDVVQIPGIELIQFQLHILFPFWLHNDALLVLIE